MTHIAIIPYTGGAGEAGTYSGDIYFLRIGISEIRTNSGGWLDGLWFWGLDRLVPSVFVTRTENT